MDDTYEVAVVGAGIAGSTLAAMLARKTKLALIDRDIAGLPGSTGHAPGIVAQINAVPALSELARRSVAYYRRIPDGFQSVGGLEVALGPTETQATMEARAALAHARGISAEIVSAAQAQRLAPAYVRADAAGAVHFPDDGVANARGVAAHNHQTAAAAGATLVDGDVESIKRCAQGYCLTLTGGRTIKAAHVAICTGVWAGQLAPSLAAASVGVAHPYIYSAPRPDRPKTKTQEREKRKWQPFVRFPGQHVYARDHGGRDGLGTYQHEPVHVTGREVLGLRSAYGTWEDSFRPIVQNSLQCLPAELQAGFKGELNVVRAHPEAKVVQAAEVPYAFAGLMTMTPDGLPLAGRLDYGREGALWVLCGVWVTHAAGSASVVAPQILHALKRGTLPADDAWLRSALDPHRFRGRADTSLTEDALDKYRDIWNRKEQRKELAKL